MTDTTNTAPAAKPRANLTSTEAGKAVAAKRRKATTPAKAAAKATTKTPKAPVEKKTYTATGRSGQAVYRQFAGEMKFAIDVADPKATKPLARAGQIWQMYATEAQAVTAAGKLTAKGYDVVVTSDVKVTAKVVAA
jgi:hypothetical protein